MTKYIFRRKRVMDGDEIDIPPKGKVRVIRIAEDGRRTNYVVWLERKEK